MKRRFIAACVASAFFGAAGAVHAQTSTPSLPDTSGNSISVSPNVGVGANVGISNTDINAGANIASTAQSSSTASAPADSTAGSSTSVNPNVGVGANVGIANSDVNDQSVTSSSERKRGLDRADEAAGEHGKHGRDNAREAQSR